MRQVTTETVERTTVFCDSCGQQSERSWECQGCGCDVCNACGVHRSPEPFGFDKLWHSGFTTCKACDARLAFFKEAINRINARAEQAAKDRNDLADQWRAECKRERVCREATKAKVKP